ncbi:MAG: patatin-like phospholipase family protein [Candidatus Omnitrophica bacterium]|nr:patatin-like phospholipase family protein [Candidatus Omnitrophota bacterium]
MSIWSFGKKSDFTKEYSLQNIPLFAGLTPIEINTLEKYVRLVECKRGDIIYEQGAESDAFYVIISGRFKVLQKNKNQESHIIAYYHRGDYFGEVSLLTEKPHSVTIQAVNDALIFKIDKKDFLKLLADTPSISVHLSRSLGMRLKQRDDVDKIRGSKIVSVFSAVPGIGKTTFVVNLAASLFHYAKKKVAVVELGARFKELEKGVARIIEDKDFKPLELSKADFNHEKVMKEHMASHHGGFDVVYLKKEKEEIHEKKIVSLLTFLLIHYDVVLVDMPLEVAALDLKVLSQSDNILFLCRENPRDLENAHKMIHDLEQSFQFLGNEIRLVLVQDGSKKTVGVSGTKEVPERKIFARLPLVSDMQDFPIEGSRLYVTERSGDPYSRVLRYLARDMTGSLVGLVLGSGAAFGLAHIGVIKVLERQKIPIDVIAGSSIGAFIGVLWASGYSADECEKIAKNLTKQSAFLQLVGMKDFSMAHHGFFKGQQIVRYIKSLIGEKTFQDLDIPIKVIATDLFTSEEIVLEEGEVALAVRASISIPGIFRPVFLNNRYLIDGGVIDPLPVKVLASVGVNKIISVNVLSGFSQFEERKTLIEQRTRVLEERAKKETNPFKRAWLSLQVHMRRRYLANIFNVLMQTMQFMESKIASAAAQGSDVEIAPVVTDAHWAEFYSADKFIQMGEEKAMEKLEEIKALIRE